MDDYKYEKDKIEDRLGKEYIFMSNMSNKYCILFHQKDGTLIEIARGELYSDDTVEVNMRNHNINMDRFVKEIIIPHGKLLNLDTFHLRPFVFPEYSDISFNEWIKETIDTCKVLTKKYSIKVQGESIANCSQFAIGECVVDLNTQEDLDGSVKPTTFYEREKVDDDFLSHFKI